MPREAQIERAIAVWQLESRGPFAYARFYAPETFIDGHAAVGTLTPALGAPDAAKEHASVVAKRPARLPRIELTEVEPPTRIGEAGGPAVEVAPFELRVVD